MSHFITTHNSSNESIFSPSSTSKRHAQDINGTTVETVYTFQECPPNLSTEDDVKQNEHGAEQKLGSSTFAAVIGSFPPGAETPWHRTMTVNIGIVLEGAVELHLDSGEVRTLEKGDSYTQRGTMHKWRNVREEWVRIATFTMPIVEPFELNGNNIGSGSLPWDHVLDDSLRQTVVNQRS